MKYLSLLIVLFYTSVNSQEKYLTKTGTVSFEASVPAFEKVAATNNAATAIYNRDNDEFAALVLVKGFRFKNALMEEHFNENYAESDTYPKAFFKGHIKHDNSSSVISGTLTFHGKTVALKAIPIDFKFTDNHIEMSGDFIVNNSDFGIKIPKIVRKKVSETIQVSFNFNMKKK